MTRRDHGLKRTYGPRNTVSITYFDLRLDLELGRTRARDVVRALGRARGLDVDLDLDSGHLHVRAVHSTVGVAIAGGHSLLAARELDRILVDAGPGRPIAHPEIVTFAREIDRELEQYGRNAAHPPASPRPKPPGPPLLAGRLVAAVARLLPAGDRPRYLEEFRSELADLARAGHSRWVQRAYVAWLLVSALRLRAELRVPRRRGAAP